MSACDICGKAANYSAKTGHAVCSLKCEMEVIGLTDLARNRRLRALLVEARDALKAYDKTWDGSLQGDDFWKFRAKTLNDGAALLARLDAEVGP